MRLKEDTVFITGAGSGLGRTAAELFAEEGAKIVATDIDGDAAAETAAVIEAAGGEATSEVLDVRDADDVQATVDAAAEAHGLDVILNNAGVGHDRTEMESIEEAALDRVIDINIKGVWNGCQAAIPHMKAQGSGRIVNTASLAGVIGMPQLSAYSLSKGAVVNFTRAIAAELGPHGVRANAVCPGVTDTPLARADMDEETWSEVRDEMAREYPLRRLGEPEDVARSMLFLASDLSSWVTGHSLVVDGGFSCS